MDFAVGTRYNKRKRNGKGVDNLKIKNKKRFILYCVLYVIGYLFFCIVGGINSGVMISDHPVLSLMVIYYGMPVGVRSLSVVLLRGFLQC